ncbi:hypothetical protein ACOSQ4_014448 [Xanthoceras sorbifolium]
MENRGREFGVWVDGGRDFLVCCVDNLVSEVLSQLQDWNNRRQFTPPSDFHADGVNEFFNSQAVTDGSRANEILKQAPFLVPFTSRVKIFHGEGNRKGPTSSSEEEGQQTPDPKPAPPCVAHVCRLLVAPLSCLTARVFCRQSV